MSNGTLVLMGSGETTPTMVTVHQRLLSSLRERIAGEVIEAGLLDTPYGFQENRDEITSKAQHYFDHHVGQGVELLAAADLDAMTAGEQERLLDRVRQQRWLFAGPGSPTYALRQWSGTGLPSALAEVVGAGGTVLFASAAAVTAGRHSLAVYEVYKAGEPPTWRQGTDLVGRLLGWDVAVVPHFDNAEGGTHDTRYCYMGEPRLRMLEDQLPAGAWVLGIDEHTAAIMDLDEGVLRVRGRGGVHIRVAGEVRLTVAAGHDLPLETVAAAASGDPAAATTQGESAAPMSGGDAKQPDDAALPPFATEVARLRARFDECLAGGDADGATEAALACEQTIRDWAADTQQSDEMDTAVRQLRAMITRLGALAGEGLHDHTTLVAPHIETLLHVRDDARDRKVFEVADHIRGHMEADGVVVKDTREGTEWEWSEPDH